MNLKKIKNKIKEKGLKHNFLAFELGITPTAFARKVNGKNVFTIEESKKLGELLILDDEEMIEFFLK